LRVFNYERMTKDVTRTWRTTICASLFR
jgi:hypothetical protein